MSRTDGQIRSELLALIEDVPSLLKALDYLSLFSEVRSQKRVADLRNAGPSTVSELLSRFERSLALDRQSTGRELRQRVAAGEAEDLMSAVDEVLRAAERFVVAAAELREQRSVLLGTFNSHVKTFVARALAEFHRLQPRYRVVLPRVMGGFRRVAFDEISAQLLAGQSDYIITNVEGDLVHLGSADESTIKWVELYEYRLVVAAHSGHELMSMESVTADDLIGSGATDGLGLLLGPEGFLSRDATREMFRRRGASPRVVMENPDTNTRVALALAGYGVAVAHHDGIDPALRRQFPPLVDDEVATTGAVIVAWRSDSQLAAEVHDSLIRCLSEAADTSGAETARDG